MQTRASRARKKISNFLADNCIIYNPGGSCKCGMIPHLNKTSLLDEYKKICDKIDLYNLYNNGKIIYQKDNYWLKFISS